MNPTNPVVSHSSLRKNLLIIVSPIYKATLSDFLYNDTNLSFMDSMFFLGNILRVAPEIVVLVFCIQYAASNKTIDGILLTTGAAIGTLSICFYSFILPYALDNDYVDARNVVLGATSMIGFIGQVLFAIGLVLLIKKVITKKATGQDNMSYPGGPLDSGVN